MTRTSVSAPSLVPIPKLSASLASFGVLVVRVVTGATSVSLRPVRSSPMKTHGRYASVGGTYSSETCAGTLLSVSHVHPSDCYAESTSYIVDNATRRDLILELTRVI